MKQLLVKDSFTLTTLLALGGLAQALLSLVLPPRYALLPLGFLTLRAVVRTALGLASPARYASSLRVVPGRVVSQLPTPSYNSLAAETASPFGSVPASQAGVVVFHIGARYNHPLGPLCPGGKEVAEHFLACAGDALRRADEFGCLGQTNWRGEETASNNTVLAVLYFRDLDGLNRFAGDAVHVRAMKWYNEFVLKQGYSHIGIYHETFCAPPGGYETIYDNMPPTLLGAASARVRNEATGEDEWAGTLVDGRHPALRTQLSRMGRQVTREAEKGGDQDRT